MKRALSALILLAAAATAARAIMAPKGAREDAKRFGFNRARPILRNLPSASSSRALRAFNASRGGRWKLRFSPRTGLPASLTGDRDGPHGGTPDTVARAFLSAHNDVLGVDPATLTLDRQTQGNGHRHVLYRQKYKGIPVEFAAVKVHLDASGSVIGVQSTYEPNLSVPTSPAVPAAAAGRSAAADAGGGVVSGAPTLAIVPLESDGKDHLAWKMRVDSTDGGGWRYYVDAVTGQVLFRYSVREFITPPCAISGTVTGEVYDIDPVTTPGPVSRPFNDEYVYLGYQTDSPASSNRALTYVDPTYGAGFYCGQKAAQAATDFQGPYVDVSDFRGPSAHYDDGNGVWLSASTAIGSPHPYPANADITATVNLEGTNAVELLPVFKDFSVGLFGGGGSGAGGEGSGDIEQDDRLMISDGAGDPVANYIGALGAFNGAAVHGQTMNLTLKSEELGAQAGYDVAVSSYLTLSDPDCLTPSDCSASLSHTWTYADTWISPNQSPNIPSNNLHGELSLFYHLNLMHDYFLSDADASNAAPIVKPVVAMAYVGPNLLNAFYDPDYDDLSFGDENALLPSDGFMDDATVPHHEYTHYVVEKIWDIQNYGQAGTLSEANADYWSASSLNDPGIGTFVFDQLGGVGPLREIDDQASGAQVYILGANPGNNLVTTWSGEIHDDSPFLSQALWDIRRAEISRLGMGATHTTGGVSCADGLVFQSLLYFPESFSELYEDMLQVDNLGAVPNCGAPGSSQSIINGAFAYHGISPGGDAYEPNDGFETATDISTIGFVSATIFPSADTDFYSFGAGPGLVQATMNLPALGLGVYEDYQLKLYNVSQQQVAGAAPPSNGFGTTDGVCGGSDCTTTSAQVALSYNNPTGGLLYLQVIAGDSGYDSNSGANSTIPYTLSVSFPSNGALASSIISAKFDDDTIGFTVNTSSFVSNQVWRFAYAQLRDQTNAVLPNTATNEPSGSYLALVGAQNANGQITGSVQLVSGFASRFPSAGTVALEVFGYDQQGAIASMGVSNAFNLSDNSQSGLTAYNNLFNPLQGQKATVQYAVGAAGHVTIKLYTVTGRLVLTLFDGDVAAGKGSVDWDGQNMAGSFVASGIYVVRAVGPGLNATQKIAVIK